MPNILNLSVELSALFNNAVPSTLQAWQSIGINSVSELENRIIFKTNSINKKFSISTINYTNTTSRYSGSITDSSGRSISHISIIPPDYKTRSAFLTQQVFPSLSPIIKNIMSNSLCFELTNLPFIILNLNEVNLTPGTSVSILSAKILNLKYSDLYDRDENDILIQNSLNPLIKNIIDYDLLLKGIPRGASQGNNEYFDLDNVNKIITFKQANLGNGSGLTLEPYTYLIKSYPALFLAYNDRYSIDYSIFQSTVDPTSNENLNIFFEYILKLKSNYNNMIQKIYYGAPGTGKSFKIDDLLKVNSIPSECTFRVTFHPEFTYSDFIGQLLPKVIDKPSGDKEITYDFSKGILTQSLEKAYEDTSKTIYLILEEMSRGDVAAIFGDIFQLLDRFQSGPQKGFSRYFVNNDLVAKEITAISDNKIKLPPNLCILGTVNTSDQNVFVMDTAFKRRFDWEYISTKPVKDSQGKYFNNISIKIIKNDSSTKEFEWVKFYMALNKFISHKDYLELGEDKQIGQFFIEFDLNESADLIKNRLQNKMLQYLWNDIQKASFKRSISLFASSISSFSELYDKFGADDCVFSNDFLSCLDTF